MHIAKLHGLGNDYLFLDCTGTVPDALPELAVRLSDRHFGVGADGLICILPSRKADFRMRIFNADGSEGEMCGNGIRCMGKYLYDHGLTRQEDLVIETAAGLRPIHLYVEGGKARAAAVNMGRPVLAPGMDLTVKGIDLTIYPVSMGNPHAVIFTEEPERIDLPGLGGGVERHTAFPERTNVEFTAVESESRIRLRVWERGSGETLACGTGACAAFAAARDRGACGDRAEALLPGGTLQLDWEKDGTIRMTGPAELVFEGEVPED